MTEMERSRLRSARRSAEALVRACGEASIAIRVALPPAANDDGEELGLRAPEFQDVPVTPAGVVRSRAGLAVLIPANVLERALGLTDSAAVVQYFQGAHGVVLSSGVETVRECEALIVAGEACMYRLVLRVAPEVA